jgi:kynurenine formamidase
LLLDAPAYRGLGTRRIALFRSGEPGLGISACRYLVQRKIALTGLDNWGIDSLSGEDPKRMCDCHIEMQTRHGIWAIENLQFVALLQDKQYEFLFAWAALPMKGATGSPANPIAIW